MYLRARMGITYLPQETSIFRKLTVEENILAILETLPITRDEMLERLEEHLKELNITGIAKRKAFLLSGGERRRVEITRALVTSPSFILFDEPFTGVDPIAVHEIQNIILRLTSRGIGVIISDHNVGRPWAYASGPILFMTAKFLRKANRRKLWKAARRAAFISGKNSACNKRQGPRGHKGSKGSKRNNTREFIITGTLDPLNPGPLNP